VDDGSFEAFVRREYARLYRTALLLCGNDADAADLVQTALARMYPRWRRLSGDQPLAYARRIIVNSHHDSWRRKGRREVLSDDLPEPEPGTDASAQVADHDALLHAMRELTSKERQVVVARFVYGLNEAETAAELGWRPGTVKSTTHRALSKLRASTHLTTDLKEDAR
jgi:RNA polymerase sigma-70 factor (sigma-E family)